MLITLFTIFAFLSTILYTFLVQYPNIIWWTIALVFIIAWIAAFILFVIFLVVLASFHSRKKNVLKPKRIYPFLIHHVAVFLRTIWNLRVTFENKDLIPKDEKFLLILNHQSMLDSITFLSCFPNHQFTFFVKESLIRFPFVGHYLHAAGFISIDRKNNRKAMENIFLGINLLKSGRTLAIYPEGTRSRSANLGAFRSGAFKPAQKAEAPIVVAVADGFYKKRARFPFVPARVFIKIIEVIPYQEFKDLSTNEISENVRELIQTNMDEARQKYSWLK
jgi:1-acyl-sn-glycerol-3-phosphate acyltransferase